MPGWTAVPDNCQSTGGAGVEDVVNGFNQAYSQDDDYRTANSGAQLLPPSNALMQSVLIPLLGPDTALRNRSSLPIHFGDLTVTAIEVNHDPARPAYGYRFDFRGRSAVVSGDTCYHPPLALAAKGADVLIHEAQSQHLVQLIHEAAADVGNKRLAQTMRDIQHYHSDPLDAARIANQANVRLLVFTHLNPPISNPLLYRMFYNGVDRLRPTGWISGKDGTLISLPIGSNELSVSTIDP